MHDLIYLDNAATTPIYESVIDGMSSVMREHFGNPSSKTHAPGRYAGKLVETARRQVAALVGALPDEIVFTSGATESCNLAISGILENHSQRGKHLVVSRIEHKAVLEPCRFLERNGYSITWLTPDPFGVISADQVEDAIRDDTILVCVMAANNIIGTLNPIDKIAQVCQKHNVLYFCDATQMVGKIPVDVSDLNIDLLAFSAHKFHGPKGAGALYVRRHASRLRLSPILLGGGQENGLRSGTINVPAVVGFGMTCELANADLAEEAKRLTRLRTKFETELLSRADSLKVLGHPLKRAPHISNIAFSNVEAGTLLNAVPSLAASSGSACGSYDPTPSYVLRTLGLSENEAATAVRFSLGRFTTEEQIQRAVNDLCGALEKLRHYLTALFAG